MRENIRLINYLCYKIFAITKRNTYRYNLQLQLLKRVLRRILDLIHARSASLTRSTFEYVT